MRPCFNSFPFALTVLLSTVAAQESVTQQSLLVRWRGGVDLQLDTTACMALLNDADLRPLLTDEQAAWVNRCILRCIGSDAAGHRQFVIHTGSPRDLTAAQKQVLAAASVQLIEQRLNAVFHDPQRDRLEQEIKTCKSAWDQHNQPTAATVTEPLEGMAQSLQKRHDQLREQQSEVRITLATEARARDFVRERLQLQDKGRQDLEQRYLEASDRKNALQQEADALRVTLQSSAPNERVPDSVLHQRERVRELESAGAKFDRDLQRLQRDLEHNFRQSAFFHEQLPNVEMALLRAEVRQQVLGEEHERLDAEHAEFRARLREFAAHQLQAERMRIELRPIQQRLGNLDAELSVLQPVRVDVITSR